MFPPSDKKRETPPPPPGEGGKTTAVPCGGVAEKEEGGGSFLFTSSQHWRRKGERTDTTIEQQVKGRERKRKKEGKARAIARSTENCDLSERDGEGDLGNSLWLHRIKGGDANFTACSWWLSVARRGKKKEGRRPNLAGVGWCGKRKEEANKPLHYRPERRGKKGTTHPLYIS